MNSIESESDSKTPQEWFEHMRGELKESVIKVGYESDSGTYHSGLSRLRSEANKRRIAEIRQETGI